MESGDIQGLARQSDCGRKYDALPMTFVASHRRGEPTDDPPLKQIEEQRVLSVKSCID